MALPAWLADRGRPVLTGGPAQPEQRCLHDGLTGRARSCGVILPAFSLNGGACTTGCPVGRASQAGSVSRLGLTFRVFRLIRGRGVTLFRVLKSLCFSPYENRLKIANSTRIPGIFGESK